VVDQCVGVGQAGDGVRTSSRLGRQMSQRRMMSFITARARSIDHSRSRRLVSKDTSTPAARAISMAA
jgi:hypothetical protein